MSEPTTTSRERERWRQWAEVAGPDELPEGLANEMLGIQSDLQRAEAENARLREALEPFARWAEGLPRHTQSDDTMYAFETTIDGVHQSYEFRKQDIIAARAALEGE